MFLAAQPVPQGSEINAIALLPERIPQGHDRWTILFASMRPMIER